MAQHDLRQIAQNAHATLTEVLQAGLVGSAVDAVRRLLQPRPEDYERAFSPEVAEGVRRTYEPLWATGQLDPRPKRGQTELRMWAATSEDLKAWNAQARAFPGGYQEIAGHLAPGRLWFRWKFLEPGETLGMAFDGMVWMDDHWAWFPKPWRAIRAAAPGSPPAVGEA